jgi:hypothetical protein
MAVNPGIIAELHARLATGRPLVAPLDKFRVDLAVHGDPLVTTIAPLVVSFYDHQLDPRWLAVLAPSTRLVLMSIAAVLRVPPRDLLALARRLRALHANLVEGPGPGDRLMHTVTPLAAFHWWGWCHRRATLYLSVAPLIHVRFRELEHSMMRHQAEFGPRLDANAWDYLKTARLLVRFGPSRAALSTLTRRALQHAVLIVGAHALLGDLVKEALGAWVRSPLRPAARTVDKRAHHLATLLGLKLHKILPG